MTAAGALLVATALVQTLSPDSVRFLTPVEIRASLADDSNSRILLAEIDRVEAIRPDQPIANLVTQVSPRGGDLARAVFPAFRFYEFDYRNYMRPGFEGRMLSLAWITSTVAVRPNTGELLRLSGDDEYSAVFKASGVAIRDVKDARRALSAFNEIHSPGINSDDVVRVSATEWKLGNVQSEQTMSVVDGVPKVVINIYFVRVITDPDSGRIIRWELGWETRPK